MRINKAVFSFSLIALCVQCALADFTSLSRKVRDAHDLASAQGALRTDPAALNDKRLADLSTQESGGKDSDEKQLAKIRDAVDLRAKLESGRVAQDAGALAKSIKESRLYADPSERKGSNWLGDAWEDFVNLFRRPFKPPEMPNVHPPALFGPWAVQFMYALLGTALLLFAWFAVRYFSVTRRLRRKASALMEEDEPERTLDEWLAMAAQLEAEGKFREAVRCLYLACLLRFDESGVARFVKGQTNWEHLHRIRSSPTLPPGIEFAAPTRAFDRIWYGFKGKGKQDVDDFRAWYQTTTQALHGVRT